MRAEIMAENESLMMKAVVAFVLGGAAALAQRLVKRAWPLASRWLAVARTVKIGGIAIGGGISGFVVTKVVDETVPSVSYIQMNAYAGKNTAPSRVAWNLMLPMLVANGLPSYLATAPLSGLTHRLCTYSGKWKDIEIFNETDAVDMQKSERRFASWIAHLESKETEKVLNDTTGRLVVMSGVSPLALWIRLGMIFQPTKASFVVRRNDDPRTFDIYHHGLDVADTERQPPLLSLKPMNDFGQAADAKNTSHSPSHVHRRERVLLCIRLGSGSFNEHSLKELYLSENLVASYELSPSKGNDNITITQENLKTTARDIKRAYSDIRQSHPDLAGIVLVTMPPLNFVYELGFLYKENAYGPLSVYEWVGVDGKHKKAF